MKYQRIYDQLIFRAICRENSPSKLEGYCEEHHILPKSMGGSNDNVNLVKLTAREHYIAHHLLYKIHRTHSMACAWFLMANVQTKDQQRYTVNSKQYELAKREYSKKKSEYNILTGHKPPCLVVTPEMQAKWAISRKGNQNAKGNKNRLGKKHSNETKEKMRIAKLNNPKTVTSEYRKQQSDQMKRVWAERKAKREMNQTMNTQQFVDS